MNAIRSIYIPRIDNVFNAEFIADVFDRNGIAQVSRVYIEPYKSIMQNGFKKYNRAYIDIKSWHESETAYNFIDRLRNPTREARIVYSDDNWWSVDINKYPHKLDSKCKLTIFDSLVNYEKSKKKIANFPAPSRISRTDSIDCKCNRELKAVFNGYKDADEMDAAEAFDSYLREMHEDREKNAYKDADEMDAVEAFNSYLYEMHDDRNKWFSEQYIFDSLGL